MTPIILAHISAVLIAGVCLLVILHLGRLLAAAWARADDLRAQRDRLQDARVTWAKCPTCGMMVPCTGCISPAGVCWCCGAIISESDLDGVTPHEEHAREVIGRLYLRASRALAEGHHPEFVANHNLAKIYAAQVSHAFHTAPTPPEARPS